LTQKALSKQIGLSAVGLSKAINGNPTKDTLEKIAAALNVPVIELFEPPHPAASFARNFQLFRLCLNISYLMIFYGI